MAITAASLEVLFGARGVDDVARAADEVSRKVEDTASRTNAAVQAGGAALAGMATAAAVGFGKAVGVTMDFDKQLSAIASVGGADAQARLEDIRATALRLGADTAFSASEAADGMAEMIKAGVSVQDVLGGAAQAALDLSAASGTAVEESATIMSAMLNVFGDTMTEFATEGEKATYIADLLAQAANASATDVHGLGYALQASAAIARGFGLDAEETATALAVLAQNGMQSSDMGTSLKSMLLSVTRQTKPAKEALADLGLTFDDLKGDDGQFVGVEEMFATFRRGAAEAGVSGLELNVILNKLFGSDGGRAAQIFFRTTEEGWDAMRDGMANAGTAGEQAEERLNNLAGDMEELGGAVETLVISFTSFTQGPLRWLVQRARAGVNAVSSLPPAFQQAAVIAGGLGVALAGVAGAMAAFGPQALMVARGVALLSGPIGLVAAGLSGLYLAYRTNFLGFADGVNRAASGIRGRLEEVWSVVSRGARYFSQLTEKGINPLEAGLRAAAHSIKKEWGGNTISRAIYGVVDGVRRAAGVVESAVGVFRAARDEGFSPLESAIRAVGAAVDQAFGRGAGTRVSDVLWGMYDAGAAVAGFVRNDVLPVLGGLKDYFLEVAGGAGHINAALTGLPEWLRPAADLFGALAQAVIRLGQGFKRGGIAGAIAALKPQLSEVKDALGGLGGQIRTAIQTAVDWPGLAETVSSYGRALLGKLADGAATGWDAAKRWLSENVTAENVGSAIGAVGEVALTGISWVLDRAVKPAGDWLRETALPAIRTALERVGSVALAGVAWAWEAGRQTAGEWLRATALPKVKTALDAVGEVALGGVRWALDVAVPAAGDWLRTTVLPKVRSALGAVGTVALGGITWLLAEGVPTAGEWLGNTALPAIRTALSAVGRVAVGGIEWVLGTGVSAVGDWLKATLVGGNPNGGGSFRGSPGARIDLGKVLVDVRAWAGGTIPDVWSWLQSHVNGKALGAAGAAAGIAGAVAHPGAAITLAKVLVNVAKFLPIPGVGWVAAAMAGFGALVAPKVAEYLQGNPVRIDLADLSFTLGGQVNSMGGPGERGEAFAKVVDLDALAESVFGGLRDTLDAAFSSGGFVEAGTKAMQGFMLDDAAMDALANVMAIGVGGAILVALTGPLGMAAIGAFVLGRIADEENGRVAGDLVGTVIGGVVQLGVKVLEQIAGAISGAFQAGKAVVGTEPGGPMEQAGNTVGQNVGEAAGSSFWKGFGDGFIVALRDSAGAHFGNTTEKWPWEENADWWKDFLIGAPGTPGRDAIDQLAGTTPIELTPQIVVTPNITVNDATGDAVPSFDEESLASNTPGHFVDPNNGLSQFASGRAWIEAGQQAASDFVSEVHAAILALPVTAKPYVAGAAPLLGQQLATVGTSAGALFVRGVADQTATLAAAMAPYLALVQPRAEPVLAAAGAASGAAFTRSAANEVGALPAAVAPYAVLTTERLREGLAAGGAGVVSVARQIALRVAAAFRTAAEGMEQLGRDIVGGLQAGFLSAMADLATTVGEQTASLEKTARDAIGAKSPATKFIPVGESIPEGMGVGALRSWGELEDLLAKKAGQLVEGTAETLRYSMETGNLWTSFDPAASQTKEQWFDYHRMLGSDMKWAREEAKRALADYRDRIADGDFWNEAGVSVGRSFADGMRSTLSTALLDPADFVGKGLNADFGPDDVAARRIQKMFEQGRDADFAYDRITKMFPDSGGWLNAVMSNSRYAVEGDPRGRTDERGFRKQWDFGTPGPQGYDLSRAVGSLVEAERRAGAQDAEAARRMEAAAQRAEAAAQRSESGAMRFDEAVSRFASLHAVTDVRLDSGPLAGAVIGEAVTRFGRSAENRRGKTGGL